MASPPATKIASPPTPLPRERGARIRDGRDKSHPYNTLDFRLHLASLRYALSCPSLLALLHLMPLEAKLWMKRRWNSMNRITSGAITITVPASS